VKNLLGPRLPFTQKHESVGMTIARLFVLLVGEF